MKQQYWTWITITVVSLLVIWGSIVLAKICLALTTVMLQIVGMLTIVAILIGAVWSAVEWAKEKIYGFIAKRKEAK